MTKEKTKKAEESQCSGKCSCEHNKILNGFKIGFGFWLAGVTIWVIISAIIALLYHLL